MKRINLVNLGFTREPEKDFKDDGATFYCYSLGRLLITKAIGAGFLYLCAEMEDGKLYYDEYSQLPHYPGIRTLEEIPLSLVEKEDLVNFKKACVLYEKEYIEAESKIKEPTEEELAELYYRITEERKEELDMARKLITDNIDLIATIPYDKVYLREDLFSSYRNLIRYAATDIAAETEKMYTYQTKSYKRALMSEHYDDQGNYIPSYRHFYLEDIVDYINKINQIK